MRNIKKFLKDNQWAILALIGIITFIVLGMEAFAGAMKVIEFYVTFALL